MIRCPDRVRDEGNDVPMFDAGLDWTEWFYLAVLAAPIALALGTILAKWWRGAGTTRGEASTSPAKTADVKALGFVPDGRAQRLRLTNDGSVPAHRVRVYVNNKPITTHRGRASAEPHPLPKLPPGHTASYRYASGTADESGRAIVRIEWEDPSGGGKWESVVER